MQKKFHIIYTGHFKSRLNKRNASAQLALIINSTPEYALDILQSRKEVILFEQVNQTKVTSHISNLEQLGLVVKSVENSNHSNRVQSNLNTNSKQTAPIKNISKAYKIFIISFTIFSSVLLIVFLIYLIISGQQ